jgi:hypothetical protein
MASNTYFFGRSQEEILGNAPRYLYALRRTDEGELFFSRIDQLSKLDSIQINDPADGDDDFTEFEVGVDFFEGRDVFHELVFDNLNYEQYRWDNRSIYYYINENGELVARIGQKYTYPAPGNT